MVIVAIAWLYVVLMMSLAEALSTQGSVLGAVITFVLYGLLPLSLVLYVMGSPGRRRARLAAQAQADAASAEPDGSGLAPGAAVAPERKEPLRVFHRAQAAGMNPVHAGFNEPHPRQRLQIGQPAR